jgi:hypothetical protein
VSHKTSLFCVKSWLFKYLLYLLHVLFGALLASNKHDTYRLVIPRVRETDASLA